MADSKTTTQDQAETTETPETETVETAETAETETPETETPDVAETPETETVEQDLTTVDGLALAIAAADDARIEEEDLPTVAGYMGEVRKLGVMLGNFATKGTHVRILLAKKATEIMPLVKLPSGFPDWDGTSKGFKILFDEQLDHILTEARGPQNAKLGKQEIKNLRNSIRQHVKRTYLEPAIRAYVYETSETVRESMPNGRKADGTFKDHDSEVLKMAVKREYERSQLTVPNRYLSPEEQAAKKTNQAGPGADGPHNPAETFLRAVEGAGQMAVHYHAGESLVIVSALVRRITDLKSGEGFDRDQTAEYLVRIAEAASWAVGFIRGGETDPASIAEVLWSEQDGKDLA